MPAHTDATRQAAKQKVNDAITALNASLVEASRLNLEVEITDVERFIPASVASPIKVFSAKVKHVI